MTVTCAERVQITALDGLPLVNPGDDLAALLAAELKRSEIALQDGDVLVVTSKIVSRAEARFTDLATVEVSSRARELAARVDKDARLVELILRESSAISRAAPGVLVVRHRLGFVSANAGIDSSNAQPPDAKAGSGPWVLLVPRDPDRAAESIRAALHAVRGAAIGVVISDSLGRPFRLGSVGVALGVAGIPALCDVRGQPDLFGRPLEYTQTALADQIAAVADLVAGQGNEGRAVVHLRGLSFEPGAYSARDLLRPPDQDLYT
ncbi:MAG: coenzyme F420-0:L-glutamate ligase [Proteobacteria bacterium]|nr:coenzyme F420-0:L-glutamate ligase [Pseudomonadota bacterium]